MQTRWEASEGISPRESQHLCNKKGVLIRQWNFGQWREVPEGMTREGQRKDCISKGRKTRAETE